MELMLVEDNSLRCEVLLLPLVVGLEVTVPLELTDCIEQEDGTYFLVAPMELPDLLLIDCSSESSGKKTLEDTAEALEREGDSVDTRLLVSPSGTPILMFNIRSSTESFRSNSLDGGERDWERQLLLS